MPVNNNPSNNKFSAVVIDKVMFELLARCHSEKTRLPNALELVELAHQTLQQNSKTEIPFDQLANKEQERYQNIARNTLDSFQKLSLKGKEQILSGNAESVEKQNNPKKEALGSRIRGVMAMTTAALVFAGVGLTAPGNALAANNGIAEGEIVSAMQVSRIVNQKVNNPQAGLVANLLFDKLGHENNRKNRDLRELAYASGSNQKRTITENGTTYVIKINHNNGHSELISTPAQEGLGNLQVGTKVYVDNNKHTIVGFPQQKNDYNLEQNYRSNSKVQNNQNRPYNDEIPPDYKEPSARNQTNFNPFAGLVTAVTSATDGVRNGLNKAKEAVSNLGVVSFKGDNGDDITAKQLPNGRVLFAASNRNGLYYGIMGEKLSFNGINPLEASENGRISPEEIKNKVNESLFNGTYSDALKIDELKQAQEMAKNKTPSNPSPPPSKVASFSPSF